MTLVDTICFLLNYIPIHKYIHFIVQFFASVADLFHSFENSVSLQVMSNPKTDIKACFVCFTRQLLQYSILKFLEYKI